MKPFHRINPSKPTAGNKDREGETNIKLRHLTLSAFVLMLTGIRTTPWLNWPLNTGYSLYRMILLGLSIRFSWTFCFMARV